MEETLAKVIFVLLIFHTVAAKALEIHSKVHQTSIPYTKLYKLLNEDNKLVYRDADLDSFVHSHKSAVIVTVNNDTLNNSSLTYNCIYGYEKENFDAFQIETKLNGDKFFVAVGAFKFNQDWKIKKYKILIFDLPTCRVIEQKSHIFADRLVFDSSSNDIFFTNSTLCGEKYCKVTLDSQLNVVAGPEPWIDIFGKDMIKVQVKTTGKDEIHLIRQADWDGKSVKTDRVTLISKNGSKVLIEKLIPVELQIDYSHDVISSFLNYKTSLNISRYDVNGNLQMQMNLNSSKLLEYEQFLNTRDGGFIVLQTEDVKPNCNVHVTKYNKYGEVVSKPAIIGGFATPHTFYFLQDTRYYENIENEMFCIVEVQVNEFRKCDNQNCVDLNEKCFREEDLELL